MGRGWYYKSMYRYRWWMAGIVGCILVLLGILAWQSSQSQSLLPANIAQKIHGFTPYFYKKFPAGYTADLKRIVYDNGVLMVSLTKDGGSPVVITEQAISANLSMQSLQQNGEAVQNTAAPASINDVEDRFVGTMIAQNDHTLILITATSNDDAVKSDITLLLRGLQPLR